MQKHVSNLDSFTWTCLLVDLARACAMVLDFEVFKRKSLEVCLIPNTKVLWCLLKFQLHFIYRD